MNSNVTQASGPLIEIQEVQPFSDSLEHLLAELECVNLRVRMLAERMRRAHGGDEQLRGLVIEETEIDELLKRPQNATRLTESARMPELKAQLDNRLQEISSRKSESTRRGVMLRLDELQHLFGLSLFELDCLLICLAGELDPSFERLYAYLQDDVTRKRPSIDLILNLLCRSFPEKLQCLQHFSPVAPLVDARILQVFDDPAQSPSTIPGRYLRVDDRIVLYLLGSNEVDFRICSCLHSLTPANCLEDLVLNGEMKGRLKSLAEKGKTEQVVFYFQGAPGTGKQATAEALCGELGIGLLVVDVEGLLNIQGLSFETAMRLAVRESLLLRAALYLDGVDPLLGDERKAMRKVLCAEIQRCRGLVFLAGEVAWAPAVQMQEHRRFLLDRRLRVWYRHGRGRSTSGSPFPAL